MRTENENVSSSSSSTNWLGLDVHTWTCTKNNSEKIYCLVNEPSIWKLPVDGNVSAIYTRDNRLEKKETTENKTHLLLCDLHVQHQEINKFI